ncbi:MAG TPA: tetratricopeptide repeat protein [Thermoanaerobaculia bacterium]|nr:tetratricopeptide repeat protein [Thermoanaerobaculia bacterium]
MSYPGNLSLSTAVKDRVVSTFKQTLALYKQGRADEVAAGCALILQMDPMFDPAKKLAEKLRNPNAPINVDTLLPDLGADDMMNEARRAMIARDFERVVHLTTEILTNDLLNDEARILNEDAREKMEAAPFIEQFVRRCEQQFAAGNTATAKADLEKARALDPTHPDVVRLSKRSGSGAQPAVNPSAPSFGSSSSPSFVVDNTPAPPSAAGRGTAHATDFGFTFEEEKPADSGGFASFSFDTPAAQPPSGGFSFGSPSPAPAPSSDSPFAGGFSFDSPAEPAKSSGNEFDFSTASIETSADDQRKIDQYLGEGDRAYDSGNYQNAIEAWSRIFLIDVTNEQASERIERAKLKRRDIEQRVETLVAEGTQAFDRRKRDEARAKFAEALRLDPNNASAQEYMAQLTDSVAEGGALAFESPYTPPSQSANVDLDFFEEEPGSGGFEAPLMPPEPGELPSPSAQTTKSKKSGAIPKPAGAKKGLPIGAIVTVLAVLVLGGGGWYVWTHFLNKGETEVVASDEVFTRAASLAKRGKYDEAIAALQAIKAGDPQHDRAARMISDYQQKKSTAAEMIDGKPAAQFYTDQIAAGQAAYNAHDYDAAKNALEQAMRVKPLDEASKNLYGLATQKVGALGAAKALFGERRYAEAVTSLQPLLAQDPENKNIQRLITDAHFNLGAVALQDEKLTDAIREFDEVLRVDPNDELAKRSKDLALRYDGQPRDLLYRIYVKYLPLRQAQ